MAWDPTVYMRFGTERTRPAAELLARVGVETPSRVADLGCGPGNSTALLAERWPEAQIEGIDNSEEMLAEAKISGVPAQWVLGDAATWSPRAQYDVVFSNATLQWLGDHRALLPRLMGFVAEGGVLAVQMPKNFREPSHTLMREVAKGKSWAHKFDAVRDVSTVLEPDDYFDALEPHAAGIDIWETTYIQVLTGEGAVYHWTSGTGLRPFANALEGAAREEFLALYRAALARAYPMRPSGVTLFPFQRLFIVARR